MRKIVIIAACLALMLVGCGQIDEPISPANNVKTETSSVEAITATAAFGEASDDKGDASNMETTVKEAECENSLNETTITSQTAKADTNTRTEYHDEYSEPIITTEKQTDIRTEKQNDQNTAETPAEESIYDKLDALEYIPITCDGLPEYKLTADNGAVYWLNSSGKWVWKNGVDAEAVLPQEIISWLDANQSSVALERTEYDTDPKEDICDTFATSRVDWYSDGKELADGIWDKLGQDHTAVITSTNELQAYLLPLYREGVISKYLQEYNDNFF